MTPPKRPRGRPRKPDGLGDGNRAIIAASVTKEQKERVRAWCDKHSTTEAELIRWRLGDVLGD